MLENCESSFKLFYMKILNKKYFMGIKLWRKASRKGKEQKLIRKISPLLS